MEIFQELLGCIRWEKHNVIMVMLGTSGFSWDETNKMMKCERQSYDEFLKLNQNRNLLARSISAFGLSRSFPLYSTPPESRCLSRSLPLCLYAAGKPR
ncbi:unnamed protein product [Cuscuta campestris]|uniref:Myb/SANT-like domain-containing protein n=1 Tax=Cuscuta campestris TaxID=132261 RepID=A0A484KH57_9ASTE|nr:unnamed protein product [Cuscuta campestris]